MKTKILLPLSLLSLTLLQACGGGSDDNGFAAVPPPSAEAPSADKDPAPMGDSGTVSAQFVRGEIARYQLLGMSSQSFGKLTDSEQAASGAMTKLNDTTLTAGTTHEINGDASFAMGRWIAGTVTRASGAETLTATDNRAYHYVALNSLAELPDTGTTSCDAGVFTSPTYLDGGSSSPVNVGAASGSASLSFGEEGAIVSASLSVSAGDATATTDVNTKIATPTSTPITGAFLSRGSGAAVTLGDHGNGAYVLATGYVATLPTGARYQGMAVFRCA